jgi:hypothetical protein
MKTFKTLLIEILACSEARDWAGDMCIEDVVSKCHRGDWLLWLAKKVNVELKPFTLAKARCAKTVIHLMEDQRSIDAVNLAEKFGLTDEVSLEDLKNAADAAADAADNAASYAAYADHTAASYAADAVADDADDAAYAYERIKNQKQTADICREILGKIIIEKVNKLLIS